MKSSVKLIAVATVFLFILTVIGCATSPKKDDAGQKDALIQSLTDENAALRADIERLNSENEELTGKNLQLEEKLKSRTRSTLIK